MVDSYGSFLVRGDGVGKSEVTGQSSVGCLLDTDRVVAMTIPFLVTEGKFFTISWTSLGSEQARDVPVVKRTEISPLPLSHSCWIAINKQAHASVLLI